MKIILLEDDPAQAKMILEWLHEDGNAVCHARLGAEFLPLYENEAPDLAILDWQLPDTTGIDVLRTLRDQLSSSIPVLFATQMESEADIVNALSTGADDYLVKPLRKAELLARIHALSRRAGIDQATDNLELGPIVFNTKNQTVTLYGEPITLTRKDYLLAKCMLQNMGKVLSREFLLKVVWGTEANIDTRTVDVHISRIRRSLKIKPEIGYVIKNIYQHGYRLEKLEATG